MSLPSPFPTTPKSDSLIASQELQKKLEPLQKKFPTMGVAVAVMTARTTSGSTGTSLLAGWNLHKTRFSASLVKIAPMFAAFQLRANLNTAIRGLSAANAGDLFNQVAKEWKPVVERAVRGPSNFPQLGKIFDATGSGRSWSVDFTTDFRDDLRLMASYSDPGASGRCIDALGHQYINGALAKEGLYYPKNGSQAAGGIWVGGNYGNVVFQRELHNATGSWMTGSPATFMRFLDLVDAGRLVSPRASEEMRGLMLHSWMEHVFLKSPPNPRHFARAPKTYGKLGYDYVKKVRIDFDCGVFLRHQPTGPNFRYGLVMLEGSLVTLKEVGLAIDDIMVAWHKPSYRPGTRTDAWR
jgi:hypothetical protein